MKRRDFLRLSVASTLLALAGGDQARKQGKRIPRTPISSWRQAVDWEDYSIKVTSNLHDYITKAYSREVETAFLLFADPDGIISKASNAMCIGASSGAVVFSEDLEKLLKTHANKEGYEVVGLYHSHVNSLEDGGALF